MGYVYATINKDTLAHICKEKGVSSEFLASKTKLNMSRLNQWLTPTDINLPTINQAKKIAACLHIPFAGLYRSLYESLRYTIEAYSKYSEYANDVWGS